MSNSAKKINLRSDNDKPLKIKDEEIPDLIPEKILSEWMKNEDNPYFKIQKIDYPIIANGYNYTEAFFESFISKLNRAPIPGGKNGHMLRFGERDNTDFIVTGAKIDKKKNGKGSVYLKNFIPRIPENETFIKELKSNMIDFSLVSYTKDERIENPDGSITWNVIESMGGERNDAVPYGLGAMEQKTNTVDKNSLENKNRESKKMNKEEVLKALKILKTNAEVTLPEIATAMGLQNQLITDEQTLLLSKFNTVQKMIGKVDLIDFVTEMQAYKKENALKQKEIDLTEAFGEKIYSDTKKENLARAYAESICKEGPLTKEKVNKIKESLIYKKLAAERADVNADVNDISGISDEKKNVSLIGGKVEV